MQGVSKPQPSRTTITFSLENEVIKSIEKEASQKGVSLNSMVNAVLSKHVNFYQFGSELKLQLIPKSSFLFYINHVEDEEHALHVEEHLIETIQILFYERNIPLTLKNVIDIFLNGIAISSGAIDSINYYVDEEGCTIILVKHSYNFKWSNTNCYAFKRLFERLFQYHVKYEALSNSYVIKIIDKNIST